MLLSLSLSPPPSLHNFNLSHLPHAVMSKKSAHDKEIRELRSELEVVNEQKIDTERQLNEMEQSLQVCRRHSSQGGGSHVRQQVSEDKVHLSRGMAAVWFDHTEMPAYEL